MLAAALALSLAAAPSTESTAAQSIDPAVLRGHIRFLASDALEGRGPATRGDRLAQEYIATELETLGFKPGAPGGKWFQPFDIVGVTGAPKELKLSAGKKKLSLKAMTDMIGVAGKQEPQSKLADAEIVFVGFGIQAPEFQWDDYKGADLKGKVLLMMNSDPEDDPALFAGKARLWYGRWDYKYEIAAKVGAAGAIIIHTTPSAGYPWHVVTSSWSGEQFELPHEGEPRLVMEAFATEDASRKLAALGGHDLDALRASAQKRDFKPVPLGVKLSTEFKNVVQRKTTANVIGELPGADPKLAKQVVLYTAHHDHLGISADAKPGTDAIFNGAVDNAAGVAAMLAVARAFTRLPSAPKRTIVFAAVAAEEQGLLGSQFLAEHPVHHAGNIAVNINIDGANIWGRTKDVTVIGLGKSNVDAHITALAQAQGRVVKGDQLADRGFFYRSDQFNFAKQGVPAAYFGGGLDFIGKPEGWGKGQREIWEEKHYHQPSDELTDAWDFSGIVEDSQLYFLLGARIGNAPEMPAWVKGDEFEEERMKAIEAAKVKPSP